MRGPAALLALALLLAGCTGGSTVTNDPGSFHYSGGGASKTGTEEFTWQNPNATAQVKWSGGGDGAFTLTLLDAAKAEVFQRRYSGSGDSTETTGPGAPGGWTVRMAFEGYSGGMDLRITAR
jgi:hypothetical protein